MKCMDCLPLIEEFFDGEVDEKTGERMNVHLASCAECARAIDSLRAEQELFLRYDRELEVSPALWHGVRMRIAEEKSQSRPSFLVRVREQLGAAIAALTIRPAFASSLALVIVGVMAATLWISRSTAPVDTKQVVRTEIIVPPDLPITSTAPVAPTISNDAVAGTTEGPTPRDLAREASRVSSNNELRRNGASAEVVSLKLHDVPEMQDELPVIAASVLGDIADAAAKLNQDDEAVARHVEKAQVLLRSFKNARTAEDDETIAYERDLSRKLLDENISLRLEAETSGNKTATRVLSSLEPFLVDISNLRERPSRGDVRSIKDRMEKEEIIAALHVYDD